MSALVHIPRIEIPYRKRKEKKKSKKGATVFWIIVVILLSVAAQTEEYWDSIGYRIESFINDEFGINPGSVFSGSDSDDGETETKDWDNKVSKVAESTENIQGTEPDTYIFRGRKLCGWRELYKDTRRHLWFRGYRV